jgi:hypothetical protein
MQAVIVTEKKICQQDIQSFEDNEMKYILGLGMIVLGFGALGYAMIQKKGLTISSWWRSVDHNASVGGLPTSWHLLGLAYDVVPATDAVNVALQTMGFHTLNEGDHIHAQWIPAVKKNG